MEDGRSRPSPPFPRSRPLLLANDNLIEIGAHTVNHPSLSSLPLKSQRHEILESKARLEDLVGSPVTSFAYPYGKRSDYSARTVALVQESGFTCACSNFPGLVYTVHGCVSDTPHPGRRLGRGRIRPAD